jgi:hypothetical protein
MAKEPTFLGTVEDVEGATARVLLDDRASLGLSFVGGYGYRVGQVGSFVRIPLGYKDLFGVVSQVGASAAPRTGAEEQPEQGNRWMTVQLIGGADRSGLLQRGLSLFPTVGDGVHLVTENELSRIYGRPDSAEYLKIGTVVGSDRIPSLVDINKLVTRHSAVVGSTGSGKSTTVAGLLYQLANSEDLPSPRVLVLDVHGEYAPAMRSVANVFSVDPDEKKGDRPLHVPYWALTFEELLSVTFGKLHNETDRGAIIEHVLEKKRKAFDQNPVDGISRSKINVDTPVPFSLQKLWFDLYRLVVSPHTESGAPNQSLDTVAYQTGPNGEPIDRGNAMEVRPPKTISHSRTNGVYLSHSPLNIRRQLEALAFKLRDSRYDFLFEPGAWMPNEDGAIQEDLDELLESWLGPESGVSILDLSGIPTAILDTLVGALLRIVYDSLFWSRNLPEGGRERPLLIVLEEAHSYIGNEGKGSAAESVQRIAKEGRKYGIGVMLISQRPTEIDSTILSQCGTLLAMRLANSEDRGKIKSAVSDNLGGVLNQLPVLRTGEAIIVGDAVRFPTRTQVEAPPSKYQPDSQDPLVYSPVQPGGWDRERLEPDYKEVLELWRRQDSTSTKRIDLEEDANE